MQFKKWLIFSFVFRLMCECIINSEYLVHTNSEFWIECFHIIKSILATVDYKGVREIMKVKLCKIYFETLNVLTCL